LGIKVVTDPLCKFDVAFVLGIFDGLEQFTITPRPAAVLRRTAAAHLGKARIKYTRFWIGETLDLDGVFPSVTEVIEIDELLRADVFEDVVKLSLARIKEVAGPIRVGIGRAPADVAGADFLEVAVSPAHGRLNGQVQPVEPDVEGCLDTAQDRGADVVERDLEPGDGVGAHTATLQRCIATAQFQGKSSSSLWMA
jgi:hypothetical protein